jgi:hypothetical protein
MKLNTQFLFAALTAVSLMTPACGGDSGAKKVEEKKSDKTETKADGSKTETKVEEKKTEEVKPADPAAPAAGTPPAAPAAPAAPRCSGRGALTDEGPVPSVRQSPSKRGEVSTRTPRLVF